MQIQDKRVVVTGAASGIGKALCEAFNNAGETDDTATTSTSTVTETEEERGTVISEIEADEKLSKYDALMKEEEEKEEAMKQNASTEETEQNSPPEIEELPSLDEEPNEEKIELESTSSSSSP